MVEYLKHVSVLGDTLLSLLSEALGLQSDHLHNMECSKRHRITCHYYPACPQPQLSMGITKHSDVGFLTILLQSHISGIQVFHQGQWIDIEPIPGGLVVNIADLLEFVSNGRFRSSIHRVVANPIGPRMSVAYFISGPVRDAVCYGPIKELISEESPAKYREVVLSEYLGKFFNTGLDKKRVLDDYKL